MFLTLEDPRAQVKGSRDPLGVQTLWSGFGRRTVANLTTVTNSIRNFTVLLIGRHLGAILAEREAIAEDEALDVFLRWEQVAGYARYIVHEVEGDIRGITRIKANVRDGEGTVAIGVGGRDQILSDQQTYGIWGLYTAAARASGLLPAGLLGLTDPARLFVDAYYLPLLDRQLEPLLELVQSGGDLSTERRGALLRAVAGTLEPGLKPPEVAFYAEWLRDALGVRDPALLGSAPGRQARLARIIATELDLEETVGRDAVLQVAGAARAEDPDLTRSLERIADLEALLAPAEALFEHVLVRPGQTPAAVAGEVRKRWGAGVPNLDAARFVELMAEIEHLTGPEISSEIQGTHRALRTGAYADAVEHLLSWNSLIMGSRGGPAWASIEKGRLNVRFSVQEATLPDGPTLATYWRNTYFLDSLRWITHQIEERRS